jgi:hypothetical protein
MAVLAGGAHLAAQQTDDIAADARMRLGTVRLAPTVEFVSGIDSNVFNTAENPRSDFTWTLSPKTEAAMRLGKAQLAGKVATDFIYFQRSATERSVNIDSSIKLALPFNRVRPYVSSSFLRTRQRPSLEIDARSLRHEQSVGAGVAVRVSGKTDAEITSSVSQVAFDAGETYFDTYLQDVFNRTTTTVALSLRQRVTPLTTMSLVIDAKDEAFALSPARDSRSIRVAPEFEFASTALVSGKASVGYRQFRGQDASMPDFNGTVATAELGYTLLGVTRFTFQARRDVEYSFEPRAPYYVLSGIGGDVTQQVSDSIGLTVRTTRYQLAYRNLAEGSEGVGLPGADVVTVTGGGVIYKVGRALRIQVNVDDYRRVSALDLRAYNGLRAGTSVLYGF